MYLRTLPLFLLAADDAGGTHGRSHQPLPPTHINSRDVCLLLKRDSGLHSLLRRRPSLVTPGVRVGNDMCSGALHAFSSLASQSPRAVGCQLTPLWKKVALGEDMSARRSLRDYRSIGKAMGPKTSPGSRQADRGGLQRCTWDETKSWRTTASESQVETGPAWGAPR